jgi:hypothetical protein
LARAIAARNRLLSANFGFSFCGYEESLKPTETVAKKHCSAGLLPLFEGRLRIAALVS